MKILLCIIMMSLILCIGLKAGETIKPVKDYKDMSGIDGFIVVVHALIIFISVIYTLKVL